MPDGRPGNLKSFGRVCCRSICRHCRRLEGHVQTVGAGQVFQPPGATRPLTQLPTDALINSLSGDYLHALVCKAALHAFAAENEARMEAMSAAGSQITRELGEFEATLRQVRQEAITAEIIELGTGTASARGAR